MLCSGLQVCLCAFACKRAVLQEKNGQTNKGGHSKAGRSSGRWEILKVREGERVEFNLSSL